ncbi:hypothetical protein GpSGHVEth148 [Glossina pallidipes salivary gland hypertrophy virus]|uniref:Uncharacterized protein n=1 Tax=Glossina hytrovirus (isolate Glossina pallidipes/Ethiopia/Seibersdorf/-) TaxID=379529 RepID=A0A0Y0JE62_GHVS|nr:hypothetical protein GpSGHVEth148 [Glossina pallidipes salivary gland hypertrophy virus]
MEDSRKYFNYLRNSDLTVKCYYCGIAIRVNKYNKHLAVTHSVDTDTLCIWCLNKWKKETPRNNHYRHMLKCFLDLNEIKKQLQYKLFLSCTQCDEYRTSAFKVQINETSIETNWDLVYKFMPQKSKNWINFNKLIGTMGFDVRWPTVFLEMPSVLWYYLSIKYNNWDHVAGVLNNSNICVLPHWCLCNKDNRGMRCKHLILIVLQQHKKTFFKNMHMMKIQFNYSCITIISEFFNAIQHISEKNAKCDGKAISKMPSVDKCTTHYYINAPVPPHFTLLCAGLFPNSQYTIATLLTPAWNIENLYNIVNNQILYCDLLNIPKHTLPYENILTQQQLHSTSQPLSEDIVYLYDCDNKLIYFKISNISVCTTSIGTFNKLQDEENGGIVALYNGYYKFSSSEYGLAHLIAKMSKTIFNLKKQ